MSVLFVEFHAPRLPGRLKTALFPGVCLLVVTLSWARGTLPEAIYRGVTTYRALKQKRDSKVRFRK